MIKCELSIIIPMYNVENYIEKCVGSILTQNVDFEFEIIMVNDGSTDSSLEKAKKLASKNSNINVISQQNKGLGGARNTGITNASGKYLLFLDADDIIAEDSLRKLATIATVNNLDILEFAVKGITEEGSIVYSFSSKTDDVMSGITYCNSVKYMNSACNKLYKRDFLIEHNLFFLEKIYIEDFEFNTRAFALAQRILATDILGAHFLQSNNSITRNTNVEKRNKMIQDIKKVITIINKKFLESKKHTEFYNFYLEKLNFLTATLFYKMLENGVSYKDMISLKNEMQQQNIFFVDCPIHDRGKNILRKVLLKNIYLYPVILPLFRLLKK